MANLTGGNQNLSNYQAIPGSSRPHNFGGTADLYQNVTPPSYNSVVNNDQNSAILNEEPVLHTHV